MNIDHMKGLNMTMESGARAAAPVPLLALA